MPNELPYLCQGNESHDGQKQVSMSKNNKNKEEDKKFRLENDIYNP